MALPLPLMGTSAQGVHQGRAPAEPFVGTSPVGSAASPTQTICQEMGRRHAETSSSVPFLFVLNTLRNLQKKEEPTTQRHKIATWMYIM